LVGGEGNDDITHNIVSVDCWYYSLCRFTTCKLWV